MAASYLVSLSIGVVMVSLRGSSVDLMHVLFGTVLALNNDALWLIGLVTCITLVTVVVLWRALVAECLDPLFLRSVSRVGGLVHFAFLGLVVLNLVAGFQALGTLLSVGLMILPGAAARFWVNDVLAMCLVAIGIGSIASLGGLLLSYHASLPSGPAIILSAGGIYVISLLAGPQPCQPTASRGPSILKTISGDMLCIDISPEPQQLRWYSPAPPSHRIAITIMMM